MPGLMRKLKERVRNLVYQEAKRAMEQVLLEESFNIERQIQRLAMERTAQYVFQHVDLYRVSPDRLALLNRCLAVIPAEGLVLEFGVFKGYTIRHIAGRIPKRQVFGFDSFEGLHEPWMYHDKGAFQVERLPAVPPNVTLVKGYFHETSESFLAANRGNIAFMHIDSDLYSSCKYIFETYDRRITKGTVIVFDDFYNFPRWEEGEFKAFREWCAASGATFEFLGFTARRGPIKPNDFASGHQVGIVILGRGTPSDASQPLAERSQTPLAHRANGAPSGPVVGIPVDGRFCN